MIEHLIAFANKDLYIEWRLKLNFRLHIADQIHIELLERLAKTDAAESELQMFNELTVDKEFLPVESVYIDHIGVIGVSLKVPIRNIEENK